MFSRPLTTGGPGYMDSFQSFIKKEFYRNAFSSPLAPSYSGGGSYSPTEGLDLPTGGIGNRSENIVSQARRTNIEIMTEREFKKQEKRHIKKVFCRSFPVDSSIFSTL